MSMPAREDLRPEPRIVGRYALYGEIASGGMATVHFGRLIGPVGFSRPVAIKRLYPHCARDPQFTKMFIDEARLASRIQHPNVVSTLDVVATGDELLLVMDYVQGESLARLFRRVVERGEVVPVRIALAIMCGVLHGLHAAHEARSENGTPLSIVHRDVSPQNIIVGVDGIARVLDFGIAQASARLETTQEGHVKGKVTYMAPEQLAGQAVDRRADLYAAAIILWELFVGRKLFEKGDAHTVLMDKMFKAIERPSVQREELSDALDAVTMHALEKSPDKRFGTAREMALAFEKYAQLATPSEVGAWVESVAREALSMRSLRVAEFESEPPASLEADAPARRPPASGPRPVSAPPPGAHEDRRAAPAHEPSSQPAVRNGMRVMRSDKYPVTPWPGGEHVERDAAQRGSTERGATERATVVDAPRARAEVHSRARASRASMRPSMIGLEVAKFSGLTRLQRAVALAVTGTVLGVAFGLLASAARDGHHGDATGAVARTATPAPPITPPLQPCPAGMVGVPGGKFFMGSDDGLPLERPAHQVSVSPFCIDPVEVTVERYKACSDRGDCKRAYTSNDGDGTSGARSLDAACNANDDAQAALFPWRQHAGARAQEGTRGKHPVNCVSWEMAEAFCATIDARLPTEAEWEYAARGSDGRRFPWGDDAPGPRLLNACGKECADFGRKVHLELGALYDVEDGWPTTAPVGSFPRGRSRYGAEDMVGNVSEWVADWFAPYGADGEIDPRGPRAGKTKVVRGGAWLTKDGAALRPTFRGKEPAERRSYAIGFRCARSL